MIWVILIIISVGLILTGILTYSNKEQKAIFYIIGIYIIFLVSIFWMSFSKFSNKETFNWKEGSREIIEVESESQLITFFQEVEKDDYEIKMSDQTKLVKINWNRKKGNWALIEKKEETYILYLKPIVRKAELEEGISQ